MKTLPFTCSINTLLQEVTNTVHTLTPSRVAWGQEQPDADRSLYCVLFRKVAALSHSYHDVSVHAFALPRHWCFAMLLPTHTQDLGPTFYRICQRSGQLSAISV